jgi:hypothetical protein
VSGERFSQFNALSLPLPERVTDWQGEKLEPAVPGSATRIMAQGHLFGRFFN